MARLPWEDLQFFIAVARSGQLSAAARRLRSSHATVSRHIDRLEQRLGTRLFERNPRGYVLTAQGERLAERVTRMEREAEEMQSDLLPGSSALTGVVRLSTLEGFGNFFLASRLPAFGNRHPNLSVEVVTIQQILSLSRREADVAVALSPQKAPHYVSEPMGDYRLFVYGARDYLDRHPPIADAADLRAHRFCGYIEDMVFTPGLNYLNEILPGLRAQYQNSSIQAQLSYTLSGLGLCVLPHYIAAPYPELVPVLPGGLYLTRSYWLIRHSETVLNHRVGSLTDFLLEETARARAWFMADHL
ncbi:LysR family transcriptional regulator [Oceanicella sp. SM1341]|uniref:LysR family transcriptional regulator n=1 Tax=Oceanicella sp. SM1341 TaxID=1548889 RepID=UPI000E49BBAA|nr:LysR family transcriptional regulator [Oceanicella sp. SM1341]